MSEQFFKNGYAVIIGVDDHLVSSLRLPAVGKDVTALRDVLIHPDRCAYPEDQVKLVTGKDATRANILSALSWLATATAEQQDATAVLYYSGHGAQDKRNNRYYLIPYDVDNPRMYKTTSIGADLFNDLLADIQAERVLIMLDCCHSAGVDAKEFPTEEDDGIIAELPWDQKAFPVDLGDSADGQEIASDSKGFDALTESYGRAVLNSSEGDQKSYVRRDGKMSLFTYHLIEALTGHAPHADDAETVLVTDVMSYVHNEVKKTAAQENRRQTPVMKVDGVFPVALLIGGKGVSKGLGGVAPDPLAPLPAQNSATATNGAAAAGENAQAANERGVNVQGGNSGTIVTGDSNVVGSGNTVSTTTFNQEGQTVGTQINPSGNASIDQIGDRIDTSGGDYVAGNQHVERSGGVNISGSGTTTIGGNIVGRDLHQGDNIDVGNITGSTGVAIGRGASANVSINYGSSSEQAELDKLLKKMERALVLFEEDQPDDVADVRDEIEELREELAESSPSARRVNKFSDRLKAAALKFAESMPLIVTTADKVVDLVRKVGG